MCTCMVPNSWGFLIYILHNNKGNSLLHMISCNTRRMAYGINQSLISYHKFNEIHPLNCNIDNTVYTAVLAYMITTLSYSIRNGYRLRGAEILINSAYGYCWIRHIILQRICDSLPGYKTFGRGIIQNKTLIQLIWNHLNIIHMGIY